MRASLYANGKQDFVPDNNNYQYATSTVIYFSCKSQTLTIGDEAALDCLKTPEYCVGSLFLITNLNSTVEF